MNEILTFLRELSANNNREWFHANKSRYDAIRADVSELTERLIAEVARVDARASMLSVADCTYRIYRDTRFSADKTPYKTHIGIFINPPAGKKSFTLGYYLHIEPDNMFFAAGTICHPAPILKAIRRAIYDNIEEYISIVDDPDFRRLYPVVGDDRLKTSPQGYPRDWEYMDYIRPRNYVASSSPLPEAELDMETLPAYLRPYIEQGHRFNAFHNFTVEEFGQN